MYHLGKITLEQIAEKTSHSLAICFQIKDRGYIREGYYADLTLVDLNASYTVNKDNILYKCGWSPFDGQTFNSQITHTFVSGHLAYENGVFNENTLGQRISFDR
jgi:dihydroorotase